MVALVVIAITVWKTHRVLTTVTVPGEELQKLLAGNRLKSKVFNFSFAADGRLQGTMRGFIDKGTWTVSGDQFCLQWEKWSTGIAPSSKDGSCWQLRRYGKTLEMLNISTRRASEVFWQAGHEP